MRKILQSEAVNERRWDELFRLFQRPWFARFWIVQEVILAKKIIVLYERNTLAWELLETTVKILGARLSSLRLHFKRWRNLVESVSRCFKLTFSESAITVRYVAAGAAHVHLKQSMNQSSRQPLRCLCAGEEIRATSSISRLFGNSPRGISKLHTLEASLKVLSCCHYRRNADALSPQPSWVCGWHRQR